MYKILSLIGIFFILSCGNENRSTVDNKNDKNNKTNKINNKDINKPNLIDINDNNKSDKPVPIDINNSNKIEKINKENKTIEKTTCFFIFQRGIISVGTIAPEKGMRSALSSVLFFVGYSANKWGDLISVKKISENENNLKEKVEVKEYDSNNFFTFLELFKLEETVRKREIGDKYFEPTKGEKYNLKLKESILSAKNLNDLLKNDFFNNDYVIEEVIKRAKKSDKKFEENIKKLENDKSFTNNGGIDKFEEDFKNEIYKIFNNIINEAKNFINRIKFELTEDYKDSGFKMEITYISNGIENSFSKFFK